MQAPAPQTGTGSRCGGGRPAARAARPRAARRTLRRTRNWLARARRQQAAGGRRHAGRQAAGGAARKRAEGLRTRRQPVSRPAQRCRRPVVPGMGLPAPPAPSHTVQRPCAVQPGLICSRRSTAGACGAATQRQRRRRRSRRPMSARRGGPRGAPPRALPSPAGVTPTRPPPRPSPSVERTLSVQGKGGRRSQATRRASNETFSTTGK